LNLRKLPRGDILEQPHEGRRFLARRDGAEGREKGREGEKVVRKGREREGKGR
jgi:hypothetical protein